MTLSLHSITTTQVLLSEDGWPEPRWGVGSTKNEDGKNPTITSHPSLSKARLTGR